jgi:hypothetical protein
MPPVQLEGASKPCTSGFWVCMLGPKSDRGIFSATVAVHVLSAICWGLLFPFLYSEHAELYITGIALWVLTVYLFIHAAFSDAGVLPPSTYVEQMSKQRPFFGQVYVYLVNKENNSNTMFHKNITPDVSNAGKKCRTCQITRPPLSGHCKTCNHCISIFDHHCAYIGNCVGQRNMRVFICWCWLALSSAVFDLVVSILVIVHMANVFFSDELDVLTMITACFLCVLDLAAISFLGRIAVAQAELLYAGQTVKMRHRQGSLTHFEEGLDSCTGKLRRVFTHILVFLCCFKARPSLLSTRDVDALKALAHRETPGASDQLPASLSRVELTVNSGS